MKMRSRSGASLLVLWLGLASAWLHAETPLRVFSYDEPPLVMFGEGKPDGVLIRVMTRLFERAGIDWRLSLLPPKRALLMARTTPGSCVFPIERSQEREAQYVWISPVSISRHGAYFPPGQQPEIITLDDLRPYTLGTYLGSGLGEYLESFGMRVEYAPRNALNLEKLLRGRIDAWVSDTVSADWMARQKGVRLGQPALVFFTTVRAMGCHRDLAPDVQARLQTELTRMYASGEVDRLYAAFFAN